MARHPLRLLILLAVSVTAIGLAVPAQAAAPYCGITWGSMAKQGASASDPASTQALVDVRAGRQPCYDRLVLDVRGPALRSWKVEYVSPLVDDPRGDVIPLRGAADLRIVMGARDAYTPADERELCDVSGFTTFDQVAWAGSFEGLTSVGLGVRARLPFRAFTLAGIPGSSSGTRLVVDVAHRW